MNQTHDHIRSYVIRQARMSKHQRAALERLYPRYGVTLRDEPLRWGECFGNENRVIVEIGFGMGEALIAIARRLPDHNFFGIEVHKPGLGKTLAGIEREGLLNVRMIREDAVLVFRRMIAPGSVAGVHVFFPDPWPKKRHHKRRLIKPGFPELVVPALAPDGYLHLTTDWDDYAEQIAQVLGVHHGLRREPIAHAPSADGRFRPETEFERKARAQGHSIHELFFRRTAGGRSPGAARD